MPSSFEFGVVEYDFASQATTTSLSQQVQSKEPVSEPESLDLSSHPAIFVLRQGLSNDDHKEVLSKLNSIRADVVNNISQARLVLSFAKGATRAKFDLSSARFEDLDRLHAPDQDAISSSRVLSFRGKENSQNRGQNNATTSHAQAATDPDSDLESIPSSVTTTPSTLLTTSGNHVWDLTKVAVVRLQWLYDSIKEESALPLQTYILLEGPWLPRSQSIRNEGLKRKRSNSIANHKISRPEIEHHVRTAASQSQSRKRLLLSQETTEELEAIEQRPIPDWVRKQVRYSCQRKQIQPTMNEDFLAELRLIKHKRLLDDTHSEKIRNSYGRAIASIGAYPYTVLHPSEIEKLPQCGEKFGRLFRQFKEFGSLEEADMMRTDPKLQTLDLFWNIHGIGPHAASSLYEKGYRTIDGLRYRVWPSLEELVEDNPAEKIRLDHLEDPGLDREQQQGLKFYDDFLERIPRTEVEEIAAVIDRHLKAVTDNKAEAMLVGSYRKGKSTSGDVDIVVSHPNEEKTANLVDLLYDSLDAEGWIRAKLKISLAHTHRDQTPVFKEHKSAGGFAALDIALLVWQDINWPTKEADIAEDPDARNPATCRRVDIIVSPWKSVGCAVLGWSGGITFERDIREYADKELHLKFDSSGVMNRQTGKWVDIEKYDDPKTRAKTIVEAERRAIEGLGLECFDPKERLTD